MSTLSSPNCLPAQSKVTCFIGGERVWLFLSYSSLSIERICEEKKRGGNRYSIAADCQKKARLMMSSEKEEGKKEEEKIYMMALLSREEIIYKRPLVSHCPIVRMVPNVFSSLPSRTLI